MSNTEKINVLLIEPAFRSSREQVLKNSKILKEKNIDLYFACGLHYFDSNWALEYAVDRFDFSYVDKNLVEKIKIFEKEKNIKFSAVVSYLDSSIQFVNEACHELGLPVISTYLGKTIRNKFEVRSKLKECGVDSDVWFRNLKNTTDLEQAIKEKINYPVIAKPTEMMASLGVVKINSDEELRHWFPLILNVDFEGEELRERYGDIESSVLLEQFVTGNEYSVETVVVNGKAKIFGITKKYTSSGLYWDELGHTAPAFDLDGEDRKNIEKYIKQTHSALAFQNTITHTELRMHGKRPIIMEINPRLAGDYIYLIQEKSNKISTGDFMIQAGLGILPKELEQINVNIDNDSWSVRFLTETKNVRVLKENELILKDDDDIYFSNYVDVGDILVKPKEAYGNRVGAIVSKTPRLYPDIQFMNTYRSEESISSLEYNNQIFSIFHAQQFDLVKMFDLEMKSYSKNMTSLESLKQRFEINPKGHLVCFNLKNKEIVGFISLLKKSKDESMVESKTLSMYDTYLVSLPEANKEIEKLLINAAIKEYGGK